MNTSTAMRRRRRGSGAGVERGYGPGAWHGPTSSGAGRRDPGARVLASGRRIATISRRSRCITRIARVRCGHSFPASRRRPFIPSRRRLVSDLDNGQCHGGQCRRPSIREWQRLREARRERRRSGRDVHARAAERFNLVLGITCHAVYHAGQVQLISEVCRLRTRVAREAGAARSRHVVLAASAARF